jgi:hypothetical protein
VVTAKVLYELVDAVRAFQRLMTPLLAVLAAAAVGDQDWTCVYMSRRPGTTWSHRGRLATHPANSTLSPTGDTKLPHVIGE